MTKKYVPVREGTFRFECTQCGKCCSDWGVFLTAPEITRLKEYDIPILFSVEERTATFVDPEKPEAPPVKQSQMAVIPTIGFFDNGQGHKDCHCLGEADKDGKRPCVIWKKRPFTCSRFPFVIFTFRAGPPDLEAMRRLLEDPELSEEEAGLYVHALKYRFNEKEFTWHHLFAAQVEVRSGEVCPGFEAGPVWDKQSIEHFLRTQHAAFENHTIDVEAAVRDYSRGYGYDQFDHHFEPAPEAPGLYRPRPRTWAQILYPELETPGHQERAAALAKETVGIPYTTPAAEKSPPEP